MGRRKIAIQKITVKSHKYFQETITYVITAWTKQIRHVSQGQQIIHTPLLETINSASSWHNFWIQPSSQRKNGLFKKAFELGVLCSVDVAVIIFGASSVATLFWLARFIVVACFDRDKARAPSKTFRVLVWRWPCDCPTSNKCMWTMWIPHNPD